MCMASLRMHAVLNPRDTGASRCRDSPHLGDFERDAVLLAQLLQLGDDAVRDAGRALRVQAVHHARHQVDLRTHAQPPSTLPPCWCGADTASKKALHKLPRLTHQAELMSLKADHQLHIPVHLCWSQ